MAGPFEDDPPGVMTRRLGVIPKSSKPGHWRLTVDLSAPSSASVNDGISSADAGMAYSSIHDAARMVLHLGMGTEMAKIDIASAFRLIPVHPDNCYLLGMKWNNQVFIDQQLPFGPAVHSSTLLTGMLTLWSELSVRQAFPTSSTT